MRESWKPIVGYEGLYEISDLGRVKSLARDVQIGLRGARKQKEIILSTHFAGPGTQYEKVRLHKNGRIKILSAHRLVAIHFVENPEAKNLVLHCDGDNTNNVASNLRWGTYSENAQDSIRHGSRGKVKRRLTACDKQEIRESDKTLNELAAIWSIHQTTVSRIRHGKL